MADENPYSSPRDVVPYGRKRLIPIRESIFGLALLFDTWGTWVFNADLAAVLHTTALGSLLFSVGVFAAWGCYLSTLLKPVRIPNRIRMFAGILVAEATCLSLGLLMIHNGFAPHGLLLPVSVLNGIAVTFLLSRRSIQTSQNVRN